VIDTEGESDSDEGVESRYNGSEDFGMPDQADDEFEDDVKEEEEVLGVIHGQDGA
jgi:hypothetical protein